MRGGLDPVAGIRKLGRRLITIQMHDLHALSPEGHDVPWGTGKARVDRMILEMHRLKIRPTMVGLEYSLNFDANLPEVARCAEFFNALSLKTAPRPKPRVSVGVRATNGKPLR
jgi:sugar phosphate isomerase/epimerase